MPALWFNVFRDGGVYRFCPTCQSPQPGFTRDGPVDAACGRCGGNLHAYTFTRDVAVREWHESGGCEGRCPWPHVPATVTRRRL